MSDCGFVARYLAISLQTCRPRLDERAHTLREVGAVVAEYTRERVRFCCKSHCLIVKGCIETVVQINFADTHHDEEGVAP